jgi:hypothetical protein
MADGGVRGLGQRSHRTSTDFTSTRYGTEERKQDKRRDLITRNIDVATCTSDREKMCRQTSANSKNVF